MESPEITYGTNQEKRVLFQEAKTDFSVDPFNRLGKSRTQTNKVKTSHLGTHDVVTITEEIEDGARMDEVMELYEFLKSGGVCAVKRDSGLGFAASFNGRALKDQDRNALGVFTRAQSAGQSNAWYNDPHSGILTNELLVDTPRFAAGQQGLTQNGLLLQRQRKNEGDTDLSNWTISGAGADITLVANSTEVLSPESLNNAFKMTSTTTTARITLALSALGTTIDGVYSFYLKSDIGQTDNIFLALRGQTSGFHDLIQAVRSDGPEPNGWTRHLIKHEDGVNPDLVGTWEIELRFASSGVSIYGFAPQLEVGASVLDPSSVIIGSGLTRNSEKYQITNTEFINEKAGSVGFFFTPDFDLGDQAEGFVIQVGLLSTHLFKFRFLNSSNSMNLEVFSGGVSAVRNVNIDMSGKFTKGQSTHIGFTWDVFNNPSCKVFIDGAIVHSGGDIFNAKGNNDLITLGSRDDGAFTADGIYDQFFFRTDTLSDFDMFQMANNPQLFFERRNSWPTMILNNNLAPDENIGNGRYRFTLQLEETL